MIEEHDLAHLLQEHEAVRRELATLREAEEERARTEQALRESEARYRSLYNDTPVMLHSIDHDARLVVYKFTFTAPGTYQYECAVHGAMMTGTIVVPGTAATPTPTPGYP